MDITYLGHSAFKIKTKTATVITDPFDSKMVGFKYPTTDADIVTISHKHEDHNCLEKISGIKKVIEGPGEYEVGGVSIMGYPSFHDSKNGEERGRNTIYIFEADGLKIAHLGDLGHILDDDFISEMGAIDILMIPVGGRFTLGPKEAVEVVGKIDPYFIIPMHYKDEGINESEFGELESKEMFLKEIGKTVEVLPKFTIKREDISEEQTAKVIVLERK